MKKQEKGRFGGVRDVRPYEATDIRFTVKDNSLFAFCMLPPVDDIKILSLGKKSPINDKKVRTVTMLGSDEKINWKQTDEALIIERPAKLPDWQVVTFKISQKK
jgi:alpha-L-fucosidase